MLSEQDLIREISPNDRVFTHSKPYFMTAISAVECIDAVMDKEPRRILDLPCGHGRVMRALRARFPAAKIIACDILEDGVDFCAETFDAIPVHAPEDPRELEIRGTFDLIWCGSLLSHLRADRWTAFMDLFHSRLAKGGTLVLTTNGRRVALGLRRGETDLALDDETRTRLLTSFQSGFAYENYAGYSDYGISLSAPWWVVRHLQRDNLRLVSFTEAGWGGFQDVYAATRPFLPQAR
jgi:SAM-dependent methyltransferase